MLPLVVLLASALLAGVPCEHPGEWPHTRDAAWLARALKRVGLERQQCTGSAFVVRLGGKDLYVWAITSRLNRFPHMRTVRVAGVPVHVELQLRAVWRAKRRLVWVEAGPTSHSLPALARLGALIRATRRE